MDEGMGITTKVMEKREMKNGTSGTSRKKIRSLRYKFFKWLIPIVFPGHHIAENPPNRKVKK